jgi:hypothetical protein
METKKTAIIGLRITEELKDAVAQIARKETRSLSQQVEHFVRKGINDYLESNPDFKKKLPDIPE